MIGGALLLGQQRTKLVGESFALFEHYGLFGKLLIESRHNGFFILRKKLRVEISRGPAG